MAIRSRNAWGGLAIAIAFPALLLLPGRAGAQEQSDCTLPQGAGGLIRGDRVPNGCVLQSESLPPYNPLWRLDYQERLGYEYWDLFPSGIPVFLTLNPVVVVLDPSKRRMLTPDATAPRGMFPRRPRAVRGGNFGPFLRPFGPVIRHFGRVETPVRPPR